MLCVKNTGHFLEGQHEIDFTAHGAAHGLQLFGGAGPDKDHLSVRMLVLDQPGCERHGVRAMEMQLA